MPESQQENFELQEPLPRSKQVDSKFQQALKNAIINFRAAKSLMKHHLDEIAIMEKVVNNTNQTNRMLRDGAREACRQINSNWRNWIVSSLLTDYVKKILDNPQFNVEKIYEAEIDRLGTTIDLQDQVIRKLEKEKKDLKNDTKLYDQHLRKKLKETKGILIEAQNNNKAFELELARSRKLNELLEKKLDASQKNNQVIYEDCLETVEEKQPTTKKQFIPPPPQVGKACSERPLEANSSPRVTCS
jgi:predicted HAD superfamily phosphohydrolase